MSCAPELFETTQCLCLASRRAARRITRIFDRALKPLGLRSTQFTLLSALDLKGPQSIGALAELIGAERSTMSRNLKIVEDHALIAIRPGQDARSRIVSITARGRQVVREAFPAWKRVQAELTQTMGGPTAESLRRLSGGPSVLFSLPSARAAE